MVAALLSRFRKEPVFFSAFFILLASSVFVRRWPGNKKPGFLLSREAWFFLFAFIWYLPVDINQRIC